MTKQKFVTVARFDDLNHAQVCASALRARGMDVFLPGENLSALFYPANMVAGCKIRLQVRDEDAAEAREFLEQSRGDGVEPFEVAEEGEEADAERVADEEVESVDGDVAEAEPAPETKPRTGVVSLLAWAIFILFIAALLYLLK